MAMPQLGFSRLLHVPSVVRYLRSAMSVIPGLGLVPLVHLWISHRGVIRKEGQYLAIRVAVVSINGRPFAIVSFVNPYCFAKNLQNKGK